MSRLLAYTLSEKTSIRNHHIVNDDGEAFHPAERNIDFLIDLRLLRLGDEQVTTSAESFRTVPLGFGFFLITESVPTDCAFKLVPY